MIQNPSDLMLGVMSSTDVPARLNVLRSHTLVATEIRVEMRIIGESHWVTLQHGDRVLHEVLACVPIAPSACIFHHTFRTVQELSYGHQRYAVQAMLAPMTEQLAARGSDKPSIEVAFPHPFGGTPLPVTRIWWHSDHTQMRWWTIHTYPLHDETVAVLSASRYVVSR